MTATDRDRERAAWVLLGIPDAEDRVAYMVEQLAAERARVLAPVLAVAAELDALADEHWAVYKDGSPDDPRRANPYTEGVVDAYMDAAGRIRRAAQDGER